ncbi:MAG: hypothetical protein HOI23_05870 [Deltaproteobacteria bacterium]|jgi:copper chaperone CopZ|nr:hypothetical protein [Deltaproteobacteria bacterium]MBT6436355.1 hypothetical protein [Deltaproteobacteria bacterium]MBT6491201.1 hypothetical protein [Deltaproteobacteria bacterium]
MFKVSKTLIVLSVLLFSAPICLSAAPKAPKEPTKDQCLVQLKVADMACPMGCSPVVSKAIKTVKGVASVEVIFEQRLARVIGNKAACTQPAQEQMIQAVKKAGYSCELAKLEKKTAQSKAL